MKFGNIETKILNKGDIRKCACKTTSIIYPEDNLYSVKCPSCGITTAFYETDQEAFNAWENKILL